MIYLCEISHISATYYLVHVIICAGLVVFHGCSLRRFNNSSILWIISVAIMRLKWICPCPEDQRAHTYERLNSSILPRGEGSRCGSAISDIVSACGDKRVVPSVGFAAARGAVSHLRLLPRFSY